MNRITLAARVAAKSPANAQVGPAGTGDKGDPYVVVIDLDAAMLAQLFTKPYEDVLRIEDALARLPQAYRQGTKSLWTLFDYVSAEDLASFGEPVDTAPGMIIHQKPYAMGWVIEIEGKLGRTPTLDLTQAPRAAYMRGLLDQATSILGHSRTSPTEALRELAAWERGGMNCWGMGPEEGVIEGMLQHEDARIRTWTIQNLAALRSAARREAEARATTAAATHEPAGPRNGGRGR